MYVIVGGGVSAVACCQELRNVDQFGSITLISASPLLKVVKNHVPVSFYFFIVVFITSPDVLNLLLLASFSRSH